MLSQCFKSDWIVHVYGLVYCQRLLRCFCPSVRLSVCPSVAYIANNSRIQWPCMPKFGRKVSHLRCESHTTFKVKQSKDRVRGGRAHTVSAEPGSHTVCLLGFSRRLNFTASVQQLTYRIGLYLNQQELGYRKHIAHQLRTQYVEGIYRP